MVNQKIAVTPVDNGPNDQYENTLTVQWGNHGAVPEAPNGWVNQGYVMILISQGEDVETHYVMLEAAEMDHLIRTLKRARRKAFDARLK